MVADCTPQGFSSWGEEEWMRFVDQQKPSDGKFRREYFKGSFGAREIAMLAALAKGYLPVEYFAGIYGRGGMDMLEAWGDDIKEGINRDLALDDLGVNSLEFVENNFAAVKGMFF